ncbi:UNVERIFIED_CONTAM: Trehalase, partial [Sesamum indicum]
MDRVVSLNPIITTTLFIFSFTLIMSNTMVTAGACTPKDSGPVIPTTPLITFLEGVQEAALKTYGHKGFDPKLYVDMSLKQNLSTTVAAFDKLTRTANGSISVEELNGFLEKYLGGAAEDLVYVDPVDFVAEPEDFLPKVKSPEVRAWALEVHSLWKNLSRKVSGQVLEKPDFYTLLPLENPVIIPGSRFREVYYWDSYWVIRGLLASKMYETAKGIVYNLISLIDEFGHVLNGARAYYTNRRNESDLATLTTTSIIPVDLNVFILKMELDISFLAHVVGDAVTAGRFSEASQARKKAINSVLWNAEMQQWLDYWLSDSNPSKEEVYTWRRSGQNQKLFASNFIPLWIELFNS